jgi:hypothetical protein
MAVLPLFTGLMTEALTDPPTTATCIPAGLALEHSRTLASEVYAAIRKELLAFNAYSLSIKFAVPVFLFYTG